MNEKVIFYVFLFFLTLSCNEVKKERTNDFNDGWSFHLGEVTEAFSRDFDDHEWRQIDLPHDWAIEGAFSEDNPSGSGGGALPGGTGWYRKRFIADKNLEGKKVFIDFDGVYMNSEVWINGHYLGKRPYGYISFRYDLTPHLIIGDKNIIAVKVDNSEQPNSRWYSGCGIYRNVWLTVVNPIYVDQWGTFVTTPEITEENAVINIATKVKNETSEIAMVQLRTSIVDASGNEVTFIESNEKLDVNFGKEITHRLDVENPKRWSIENPYLYTIVSEIIRDGKQIDRYTSPLGIRTFNFDPDKGFFLNGESTKIKGVCMHHDLGSLGAAVNRRAIERQLEILKGMGVNGIRTAHNPPSTELLQLCDEMGFIVMNETFDMWRKRKTTYDYSRYFNEWHERDLTDHMLRDRNHPSIFMWSIGNEVLEQWTHADADTLNIQQANLMLNLQRDANDQLALEDEELSVNSLLTQKLTALAKQLDPTRPITAGNNEPNSWNHLFLADTLDIIGLNYHLDDFDRVKAHHPEKPFIATETTSALATRGYYRMPSDSAYIWPTHWDIPFYDPTYSCSAYDNNHVPWGSTHEETWRKVKNNDYVSGMYIWTGFDYLGEPTPYWFPARSSYFGVIDLAGFPKDAYYFYQSEWTDEPMLHVFPHWNWEEGQEIDIWAYYNNADEAELFLNGISQGIRKKVEDNFHVSWRLIYTPGDVKVVTRKEGKEILSQELRTAGEPYQIKLTPDRKVINADGTDLSFISVEVLDKAGILCPNSDNLIHFDISGNGSIAGVDNGSPISMEGFKKPYRKAFYGKCLVIVRGDKNKGTIQLNASSKNLKASSAEIKVK